MKAQVSGWLLCNCLFWLWKKSGINILRQRRKSANHCIAMHRKTCTLGKEVIFSSKWFLNVHLLNKIYIALAHWGQKAVALGITVHTIHPMCSSRVTCRQNGCRHVHLLPVVWRHVAYVCFFAPVQQHSGHLSFLQNLFFHSFLR